MSEIAPLLVVRDSDPVIRHLQAQLAASEAAVATLRQALQHIRDVAFQSFRGGQFKSETPMAQIHRDASVALAAVPAPAAPPTTTLNAEQIDRLAELAWDTSWRNHERCSDNSGYGAKYGHKGRHADCEHPDCLLIRTIVAAPAAPQEL